MMKDENQRNLKHQLSFVAPNSLYRVFQVSSKPSVGTLSLVLEEVERQTKKVKLEWKRFERIKAVKRFCLLRTDGWRNKRYWVLDITSHCCLTLQWRALVSRCHEVSHHPVSARPSLTFSTQPPAKVGQETSCSTRTDKLSQKLRKTERHQT